MSCFGRCRDRNRFDRSVILLWYTECLYILWFAYLRLRGTIRVSSVFSSISFAMPLRLSPSLLLYIPLPLPLASPHHLLLFASLLLSLSFSLSLSLSPSLSLYLLYLDTLPYSFIHSFAFLFSFLHDSISISFWRNSFYHYTISFKTTNFILIFD